MTFSVRRLIAVLSLSGLLPLASCGMFFYPENGGGGGTNCTTNCIYIANNTSDDIAQFAATNPLSVVNSVNVSFGEPPNSLAVSPNNAYLYAASASGSLISLFPVQSDGSLGAAQSEVTDTIPYALAVDTTGNYLLAAGVAPSIGTNCTATGYQIALYVYTIGADGAISDPSATPALGLCAGVPGGSTLGAAYPAGIAVSPNDNSVFIASGTAGISGFMFTNGVATSEDYLSVPITTGATSVNGVTVDPNSAYVFAAASGSPNGGVAQYTIPQNPGSNPPSQMPLIPPIQDTGDAFGAITTSGTYVYATGLNTGQVYGFSYTSTGLTALTGSPYSPSSASNGTIAIAANSSCGCVLTINDISGPNLQEFTIGTGGGLTAVSTGTTGTSVSPAALAVTN